MERYFALSRTSHALLDMAAPAFCALLWLGHFPDVSTIMLSLLTAFAAYTTVYALNDLVGVQTDRQKFSGSGNNPGYSVEASPQRHPVAQNLLSMKRALIWMGAWFSIALVGSYVLNPLIVPILLGAAIVEVTYCQLLKVTFLRFLLSGVVKTSGPIAAVFAVDPKPSPHLLLLLFAWLFFWEIGGQNVASDWNDTEQDRRVAAQTVPLRFGFEKAGIIVLGALILSVLISGFLPLISPARLGLLYVAATLLLGYFMLLRPGFQLYHSKEGRLAARLFDSASYYPLAQFLLMSAFLVADQFLGI